NELSGQLIVTQTPENHRQLGGLLSQLRETRAIQVTVETRFLTVQKNFLEDVGLDLDFAFNVNGDISQNLTVVPVTQNSISFTSNPTTGLPGSIAEPSDNTNWGLGASGTFLDDFQVNFLVRAAQASQTTTTLTAPRITLFNGQQAYILLTTQRTYVSNLTPVVGQGSSSFRPTIDTIDSGVSLSVQATVSADRKYVTMTLQPQLSQLLNLFNYTFQQSSTGVTAVQDDDGTTRFIGSSSSAPTASIQQPEIAVTIIKTTVNVPDGGTLLLGGQTLAGETEREAGVPVLSKIPFIKRLFTNRSMAKDEQVLLILVKPTIILTREAEQKQFPLLSSKISG
ncbi:MAG TPA: hypothetical protein VK324_11965, partial [Tepidisphaeraceae bacterium]|nr:hypothetical protein [Tepidisphaeraceae bacterium]